MKQMSTSGRMMLRSLLVFALLAMLGGCSALARLDSASAALNNYELSALPAASTAPRSRRHLVVELPTASAALATERIAIKPNAYRIAYLPKSQWSDPAPEQMQMLLARSIGGTGRFALVSIKNVRPDPDWFLESDLQAYQAEVSSDGSSRVTVRLSAALVTDLDRRIRSARVFESTVPLADTDIDSVMAAFDAATTAVLRDVTDWVVAVAG